MEEISCLLVQLVTVCHHQHNHSSGFQALLAPYPSQAEGAGRGESSKETLEPLPVPRGGPRELERDLGQGHRVTGQGEWPPAASRQG